MGLLIEADGEREVESLTGMESYKGYFIKSFEDGSFDIEDQCSELVDGNFSSAAKCRMYIDGSVGSELEQMEKEK